jgi:hypothetical protein
MEDWTFTERVDAFLGVAAAIDDRRLTKTGIDLNVRLQWSIGAPMTGWIAQVDRDDLGAFLISWRQLITRKEPSHLPRLLDLATTHLKHEKLRELAGQVRDQLDLVNRNAIPVESRPRPAISGTEQRPDGSQVDHELTPWDVADIFLQCEIFHGNNRERKQQLKDIEASGFREVAEWIFRQYIVDIVELMGLTRLILQKAEEKHAISNEPLEQPPSSS